MISQSEEPRKPNQPPKPTFGLAPGLLKSASLFTVCLFACFLLPLVAIYGGSFVPLRDQLFYSTQMAFPYDAVVFRESGSARRVFGEHAVWLSVLQWVLVGLVFSYLTRRLPALKLVPLAVLTIIIVTAIVRLLIGLAGAQIEYDGI